MLRIEVRLLLPDPADRFEHVERVLVQFEDFCVVTQSVRHGVDVAVRVEDGAGRVLHRSSSDEGLPA